MVRSFPIIFNQNDYLQHLGTSSILISQSGCYLCSLTTLARACGKQITPVQLNTFFVSKGLYIDQNEMMDDNLTKIFPDIVYQESINYPTIYNPDGTVNKTESKPADIQKLRELMNDPTLWVILEIDLGHGYTHFVVCAGVNGVVSIADPESGTVIDFASKYGSPDLNILKYVVYKGTPATIDSAALSDLQLQIEKATALSKSQSETISSLQDQVKQTGDTNGGKIADLTKQNNELTNQINELTEEIKSLTDSNASIAKLYGEASSKNSTSITQGVKAKSVLTDLQDYLHSIADYLKLPSSQKSEKQIVEDILDEVVKLNKIKSQNEAEKQRLQQQVNKADPSVSMAVASTGLKKKHGNIYSFLQGIGILEK